MGRGRGYTISDRYGNETINLNLSDIEYGYEDDIDVPRRRRPIASACRQQVQVDVAKEVP